MSSSSKRQTMAKMTRERAQKERRQIKQEKKDEKKRRIELGLPPEDEGSELTGDVVALNIPY